MSALKRYKRFIKETPKSSTAAAVVLHSVGWADCTELLNRARDIYEHGQEMREQMRRWTDYTQGDQWNDLIDDPDSNFRRKIREEDYIKRQGFVPLKYNIMKKSMKTTCGVYSNNKVLPSIGVRGNDTHQIGDMVTCAVRSAYEANDMGHQSVAMLEEAWQKAMFLCSVYYRYDDARKISDVYVQNEDFYKLIIQNDLHDKRLRDMNIIGMIRDMPFAELARQFADSPEEVRALEAEYKAVNMQYVGTEYAFQGDRFGNSGDSFYVGRDPNKCRVFEIWTKETEQALYCHDWAEGTEEYRDVKDKPLVDKENAARIAQAVEAGMAPEEAQLIEYRWDLRSFWYVRYLTPTGMCLRQMESPYNHGSHPFVVGVFPMVDGRMHSPAEEIIDVQRALNRTLSQIDFIRQRGAKNMLMVDVNTIPDNISWDDFAEEYSRNGSMMFLKLKPGAVMPQQLRSTPIQAGDVQLVQMYKTFSDEISGITGAMRGERANASTPAGLYAMQTQNSENNIAYFMEWFNTCMNDLFWKMTMLIQQYYDEGRYLPLAGNEFEEEAHVFRRADARAVDLYLEVVNQSSVSYYRQNFEQTLQMALQTQSIDFITYLKSTRAPFAFKLAEELEKKQQEMQAQQMMQAQQAQQVQQGQPQSQQGEAQTQQPDQQSNTPQQ